MLEQNAITSIPNSSEASQQSPSPSGGAKFGMVQSPSGNILSASEFLKRPDRKLTLAERRKAIEEKTRREIELRGLNTEDAGKGNVAGGSSNSKGGGDPNGDGAKARMGLSCLTCFK